jgi:hypothetical protein
LETLLVLLEWKKLIFTNFKDNKFQGEKEREKKPSQKPLKLKRKTKILVTRKLPEPVETRMLELFDVRLNSDDVPLTHNELIKAAQFAEILVPTVTDNIDTEIINSTGVNHVDLLSAASKCIVVTNPPDV